MPRGNAEELETGGKAPPAAGKPEPETEAPTPPVAGAKARAPKAGKGTAPAPAAGPEKAPDVEALVAEKVAAAVAGIKEEYEGKGGHLSKLKSSYEKQIAELRRAEQERQAKEIQQALALAEVDPAQAAQVMAGQLQAMHAGRQAEAAEVQMREWAEGVLEKLGLSADDQEVVDKAKAIGPLTQAGASYEYLGEMSTLALERERKARKQAEKAVAELPEMVNQAVARALAASGIAVPETAEGAAPPRGDIRTIQSPSKLLSLGLQGHLGQPPRRRRG